MDYGRMDSSELFSQRDELTAQAETAPLTPEMETRLQAIEDEIAHRRFRLVGRAETAEKDFAICRSEQDCREYADRNHIPLDRPYTFDGASWHVTIEELPKPPNSVWDQI